MGNFFVDAETGEEAAEIALRQGALFVVEVEGGYMAFDTVGDYHIWKNQK